MGALTQVAMTKQGTRVVRAAAGTDALAPSEIHSAGLRGCFGRVYRSVRRRDHSWRRDACASEKDSRR